MSHSEDWTNRQRVEEDFLLTLKHGAEHDIEFVERGGIPANWRGTPRLEILQEFRRFRGNVDAAIRHLHSGGDLDALPGIVSGRKRR